VDVDREVTARLEREHYDPDARSGISVQAAVRVGAARPFTTRTPGRSILAFLYPTPKPL
jgi:hypothetical protein